MCKYCHCNILISIFTFIFKNRPQRAKMRFWAKGKQGEKKTTQVKAATQSEVLGFLAGSDTILSHQFPDGKNGQRMEIVFIICSLFLIPLVFAVAILLAR